MFGDVNTSLSSCMLLVELDFELIYYYFLVFIYYSRPKFISSHCHASIVTFCESLSKTSHYRSLYSEYSRIPVIPLLASPLCFIVLNTLQHNLNELLRLENDSPRQSYIVVNQTT